MYRTVALGHFHPRVFEKWTVRKQKSPDTRNLEPIADVFRQIDPEEKGIVSHEHLIGSGEVMEAAFETWPRIKQILNMNYRGTYLGFKAFQKVVLQSGFDSK